MTKRRNRRRRAVLPSVILLWASAAHAAEPAGQLGLSWQAPATCPDDLGLVRAVEGFLGQPLSQAKEQPLAIEARVEPSAASGYQATLSFTSPQGTQLRELQHPDCGKLTEAAALLIALSIDPERVQAQQRTGSDPVALSPPPPAAPPPEPPSTPPPANPPARDETPVAASSDAITRATQLGIALFGLVGGGMLPSATPGVGADFELRHGLFEAALGGRYWVPREAEVPDAAGSSVRLSLATASLRLCGVPRHGDWALRLCGQAQLGSMSGSGQGVDDALTQSEPLLALGAQTAVIYSLGRLSPLAGLDVAWSAVRPRFGVLMDGSEQVVFEPHAWQVSGFIGVGYAL